MTLMLDIPKVLEARLREAADRVGMVPADYAARIIADHLTPATASGSLRDLFAEWEAEDATTDPAEIARCNEEFDQFKHAMNDARERSDGPGARMPNP